MNKIEVHPCTAVLAHGILSNSPAGTVAKMRAAMGALDALAEKAHPADPWPNPWMPYSEDERKAVEAELSHPIDPDARVSIKLTDEQVEVLKEAVEGYATKAPALQSYAVLHFLDALPQE